MFRSILIAYHSFRCDRHNVGFARHYGTELGFMHSSMAHHHFDCMMDLKREERRARSRRRTR